MEKHPDWIIDISQARDSRDITINSLWINLKLTDCKSSDNSMNKVATYFSITADKNYPKSSNWNEFLDRLSIAKTKNQIKLQRHRPSEYHYLVKNKITGDVLLKPIFDIHKYVSNPSNDLQINWGNEFAHIDYEVTDDEYAKKVQSLLTCIQTSVKGMIDRTKRFADADVSKLFISNTEELPS